MGYQEIIEMIHRAAGGMGHEAAERAARATLQTLAERLPRGEARHIQQELPAELKPWVYTETRAEALGIDEFLDRVGKREADTGTALRHARAVFYALGNILSPEEIAHLAASLPQTFAPLGAEVQHKRLELMPADDLGKCPDRLGDRHLRVGPVELVQVDPLEPQPARLPSHACRRCSGRPSGTHRPGRGRTRPPLVAITSSSGSRAGGPDPPRVPAAPFPG